MKFTTQFLTVLAATATLAVPLHKRSSVECNKTFEIKYKDCIEFLNQSDDEKACVVIESETCQKFYNTSIVDLYAEIPECKNVRNEYSEKEKEQEEFKMMYGALAKYACAKDEQGNFCSYTPSVLQKTYNIKGMRRSERTPIMMQSIKDSCKSKKCVDEFISIFEKGDKISFISGELDNKEDPTTKELITYLKSETCTAQNAQTSGNADGKTNNTNGNTDGKTDASNGKTDGKTDGKADGKADGKTNGKADDKTSGATQITYSSILIISLTVLLSSLF